MRRYCYSPSAALVNGEHLPGTVALHASCSLWKFVVALLAVLCLQIPTSATITGIGATPGAGITFPAGSPPAVGGTSTSPTITITENVGAPANPALPNQAGFWDLKLNVTRNSNSNNDFRITKIITNNSGVAWTDFHMVLGTIQGGRFVPSDIEGLFFTGSPGPSSTQMPTASRSGTNIVNYSGGVVASPGGALTVNADINVPIGMSGTEFIVRQIATTDPNAPLVIPTDLPAPGTAALLGIGGLFALRRRRGN